MERVADAVEPEVLDGVVGCDERVGRSVLRVEGDAIAGLTAHGHVLLAAGVDGQGAEHVDADAVVHVRVVVVALDDHACVGGDADGTGAHAGREPGGDEEKEEAAGSPAAGGRSLGQVGDRAATHGMADDPEARQVGAPGRRRGDGEGLVLALEGASEVVGVRGIGGEQDDVADTDQMVDLVAVEAGAGRTVTVHHGHHRAAGIVAGSADEWRSAGPAGLVHGDRLQRRTGIRHGCVGRRTGAFGPEAVRGLGRVRARPGTGPEHGHERQRARHRARPAPVRLRLL